MIRVIRDDSGQPLLARVEVEPVETSYGGAASVAFVVPIPAEIREGLRESLTSMVEALAEQTETEIPDEVRAAIDELDDDTEVTGMAGLPTLISMN